MDVEKQTGIALTEHLAMSPAASVSAICFANKESSYFSLGKIDKDQVIDYAERKKMPVGEVEKWLSSNLSYSLDD